MSAGKFAVQIDFTVTQGDEGFFSNSTTYENLSYDAMVILEQKMVTLLNELMAMANDKPAAPAVQ